MALVFDDRYQPREESAEALQRLFDVCFDSADAFSLSRAAWARQDHTLEQALEPYVLRRLRTTRWFCYYTANSNPQRIALYPLNEQTKSILRAQYRGLFLEDWRPGDFRAGFRRWKICAFSETERFCSERSHMSASA